MKFCDEIIKRGLKPVWSCNTRVDLKFETMKKMKEAGCRLLVCGYESGNQDVLNQIKKGITLEQSRAFAENARKLDIKVFSSSSQFRFQEQDSTNGPRKMAI